MITDATDSPTDSSNQSDDTTNCLLVRNELNDTPLAAAVYSGAGWEVIEALACKDAALEPLDTEGNNALHLLVSEQYKDPEAAMTILKLIPEIATMRNGSGMLPIEVFATSCSFVMKVCCLLTQCCHCLVIRSHACIALCLN